MDETDGAITFADGPSAETYGVVDEIARRVLLTGGEVLSVRAADLPDDQPRRRSCAIPSEARDRMTRARP